MADQQKLGRNKICYNNFFFFNYEHNYFMENNEICENSYNNQDSDSDVKFVTRGILKMCYIFYELLPLRTIVKKNEYNESQ